VLEGPTVAGQPGLNLLVGDDLGIHMPAEAKGHDEDLGRNDFPGKNIRDGGTFAKIRMGRIPRGKVQDTGGVRMLFSQLLSQPAHRWITAGKPELIHQRFTKWCSSTRPYRSTAGSALRKAGSGTG
jgi:hypothetical protein